MHILIFGLSDLLGRSLYKKLKEKKFDLKGFSRNKKEWFEDEFHFFEEFFEKDFEGDFYIYLSAISGDFQVEKDYIEALEINVISPLKILDKIKKGHFIYISSASVYKNKLFPEEEDAEFHNSLYGSQKYSAEGLLNVYCNKKKIRFTALRFPRIYGPYMERNPVADFLKALREKRNEVILYDDYNARYEYIFSYDAAGCILEIIEKKIEGIFNCGTGVVKTVKEVEEAFRKLTGKQFEIKFIKKRKGVDILDSSKWKNLTKFNFTDFEKGLEITLKEEKLI